MRLSVEDRQSFGQAYVVFADETSLWWLRLLKPGFRHCYLLYLLEDNRTFLELNPLSNQFFVFFRQTLDPQLYLQSLRCRGCRVCKVEIACAPLKCAPVNIFTCVEFVKRALGIHSFFTITPFQLYNKINKSRKKLLTK